MTSSRCAYCGVQANKPGQLSWVITGEGDEGSLRGKLSLCTECSHSWCPQTLLCSALAAEADKS